AEAFQRRPREQEALLAGVAEADQGLGLVALAFEADDHTLAELLVGDVVADPQSDLLSAGGAGHRPAAGPPGRANHARPQLTLPDRPPARGRPPGQLHQLLGHLGQEPAGRAVLVGAEQAPSPGAAEVETLA